VKITPDTNLLVRAIVEDDPAQARAAKAALKDAELIALPLPTLCELVWVLARGYRIGRAEIAETIQRLLNDLKVVTDRAAVDAGLASLNDDGDFADGVIAYQGRWLGGDVFVSFDCQAVKILATQGRQARVLT
jgi:predicted nucleic-acid-binding protein